MRGCSCGPGAERGGFGLLALVLAIAALVLAGALAASFQSSTLLRTQARLERARTALEAAECALAEALAALGRAADGDAGAAGLDWRAALVPPYARAMPRSRVPPERTRALYRKSHGLDVSDVDAAVIAWVDLSATAELVRGHGVIELAITAGARRVRRRVQFYCRFKPVLEWPPDVPSAPAPVAITPAIADVVILTAPLATVVEGR